MQHTAPELVTQELLDELHRLRPYDPEHLPREIELIEAFRQRHPKLPQVACFDTAFHRTMPRVAKLLPIPRRFDAKGVQRYGFHGLSYAYLMEELARLGDPAADEGPRDPGAPGKWRQPGGRARRQKHRHQHGLHADGGIGDEHPLGRFGSRAGQRIWRAPSRSPPNNFTKWSTTQSGLLGVSEISSDMRDLLAQEAGDVRAAEAVALFCYQAKKWIGVLRRGARWIGHARLRRRHRRKCATRPRAHLRWTEASSASN